MAVEDIGARRPAEINLLIAIATGLQWQVRKANRASKRPTGRETQGIAKFAYRTSFAYFVSV
jgi:hypothetical protein